MAAAVNAERFIIDLQARYTDNGEVRRLQGELDRLHQVENMRKWQAELNESVAAMRRAGTEAARLRTAMESSYDERVLARLQKADAALNRLRSRYATQEAAVARSQAAVERARTALERYSATLSATPSDREAARQAALAAALTRAENAYARQRDTLARTGEAMNRAGQRADELREALRNSVDPAIRRQYEEQIRLHERHAQAVERLRGRLAETGSALQAQGVNTRRLADEQRRLGEATDAAGRQMAALRTLGVRSFASIEEEVRRLQQAWNNLDTSNMSMRERFAHWTQYRQRIAEAREQTNGWTATVQKLQSGWAGVLGVLAGLSVVKSAVREFGTFESSMLKVEALLGKSVVPAMMDRLNQQARQLGATTRYTAAEAADGMSQLAAAGMKAEDVYKTIPGVLDAAAASGMDVGETADKVTNIMAQFGLTADRATHVADVLTVGFTGAATTMQQLSDAMVYCGPVSNALGYSLEETTAILQALANAGYKGEKAGTTLRGGFTRLIKPVKQAREVLEKYDVQVYNADGTVRKFTDILADLEATGMSAAEMIKLFGQEAGPGMVALLKQGHQAILDYEQAMEDADGRAKAMAEKMESGIEGALRRLGAAISAIAIAFGDTFAPALAAVADKLAAFATWISELPGPVKFLVGVLSGAATAFAMWKLGLGTMSLALRQFALDVGAASARAWQYVTVTLPAYIHASRLAGETTGIFRLSVNKLAGDLPLVGRLLTSNTRDLLLFQGATSKAAAAGRLLGAAFALWAAWEVGKMVGEWLNQFAFVRKAMLTLIYAVDMLIKSFQMLWNVMTFRGWKQTADDMKAATRGYLGALEDIDKEAAAQAEKKRKEKAQAEELDRLLAGEGKAGKEKDDGEKDDGEKPKSRKSAREKLDELEGRTDEEDDELDEDSDHEEGDEEDDEPAPEKPKKSAQPRKPRKARKTAPAGEEEEGEEDADTGEDWLRWKYRQIAEREAAEKREAEEEERRRDTRYRVYKEDGKWEYAYGESAEDVQRIEREAREREAARLASQRIVRQDNGWAQLLEGDKFVKALTAAEADALERRMAAYNRGAEQLAGLAPELTSSRRGRADEAAPPAPGKVVELRLGKARLTGSESDVEDFISQLERAGLSA